MRRPGSLARFKGKLLNSAMGGSKMRAARLPRPARLILVVVERLAGRPAEDSNMTSKRRRQIKIKFRAANDPGGERDLEAFVSKANLTLASLDEAEKVNEESLYWRVAPQKGRIKC